MGGTPFDTESSRHQSSHHQVPFHATLYVTTTMLGPMSFSDILGYASIGSWLGAQFPQVLENVRRQSADSLALPFLINWLLGDATNLLGCILTNQLPFQTWLATYFCFIDCTLLFQYFYYRSLSKSIAPPYVLPRSRTASTATRRMSVERGAAHYRALSNVAANVAAAAAFAAEQEEYTRWHRHGIERHPHSAVESDEIPEDEDEVSDDALARLAGSFHSEGGRSKRTKTVSWSRERRAGSLGRSRQSTLSPTGHVHLSLHMTPQPSQVDESAVLARGRPLSRGETDADKADDAEWSASNRRSSRASRKGASMVFLGVWALFGVGTLASQRGLPPNSIVGTGRVLSEANIAVPTFADATTVTISHTNFSPVETTGAPAFRDGLLVLNHMTPGVSQEPERSTEFIIGRISAWICTILYLTSRLPQIWKNFVRKSVEGLSIYLFIFAFLGNFFYVASIITSPKLNLPEPEASLFMRESIPCV
ncbi:hypothetical protein AcV7_004689 [Taiwanofungus camphoratus]|nr:hypothetical protein AcV7_004689 [Antrodia cinnamomea]